MNPFATSSPTAESDRAPALYFSALFQVNALLARLPDRCMTNSSLLVDFASSAACCKSFRHAMAVSNVGYSAADSVPLRRTRLARIQCFGPDMLLSVRIWPPRSQWGCHHEYSIWLNSTVPRLE